MAGISVPAAVGYLHFLWWWALDFAQDGDLSNYTDEDIADAMCWDEGSPDMLTKALCEAGFLDKGNDGYHIHDWYGYAGKLIERREADRERKRNAQTFRRKSDGKPQEATGNITDSIRNRTLTVPNPTVPNQSISPVTPDGVASPSGGNCGQDLAKTDKSTRSSPPKRADKAEIDAILADCSLPPIVMDEAVNWLKYKAERREGYKPTGLRNLLSQIANKLGEFTAEQVIFAIAESMACNYQGIVWDKASKYRPPSGVPTGLSNQSPPDWFVNDTPVSKDQFDFEVEHVKRTGAAARGWHTDERHFYCERLGEPCATSPPNPGQAHTPPS